MIHHDELNPVAEMAVDDSEALTAEEVRKLAIRPRIRWKRQAHALQRENRKLRLWLIGAVVLEALTLFALARVS